MNFNRLLTVIIFLLAMAIATQSAQAAEGHLRIITEMTAPASIMAADGSLTGFGVEIVRAIQKEVGDDTVIEVMPWARGYRYLREIPGVMLFPTTRTEIREKMFHWVGPIARLSWVFYGHVDKKYNIKSLDDAKKVSGIGVYRDDARAVFLENKGFKNLEVVDDQATNFKKLKRHRLDLVAVSTLGIDSYLRKNKQFKGIFVPVFTFHNADLYLAFSKGTEQGIINRWSKAFNKLEKKGDIEKILNKWK